jgi:transposase
LQWVEGERKTSTLFIHVILDNYCIHACQIVQIALIGFGRGIQLHFLPPYCPNDKKTERVWQDLPANVTRNDTCSTMQDLLQEVRYYLRKRNRSTATRRRDKGIYASAT